jgi:hypothetical protein
MNKQRIAMLALAVVLGSMTLSGPTNAQPPAGQSDYGARVVEVGQRGIEPHPEIRPALKSLEDARIRLERSAHDFHGHRAKALALTNRAIDELHKALESDRR